VEKPSDSIEEISRAIEIASDHASAQLKLLLETKHLYPRLSIDPTSKLLPVLAEFDPAVRTSVEEFVKDVLPGEQFLASAGRLSAVSKTSTEPPEEMLCLLIGNVKLLCSSCGERELFSPVWYRDLHNELRKPVSAPIMPMRKSSGGVIDQLFLLEYQCQRCKGALEAFLVRRRGWYLTLEGRSPMEGIETPKHIPKKERTLFSEAVVAMNAGKTLAALFYLRTFIEQFARRQTGMMNTRADGDEIMDAYSKTLPNQFRDQLPSLRPWYAKLSEALHAARADEALLEEAMREISRHFDIRRVFGISEVAQSEKQ
jgi:hypothetical protein